MSGILKAQGFRVCRRNSQTSLCSNLIPLKSHSKKRPYSVFHLVLGEVTSGLVSRTKLVDMLCRCFSRFLEQIFLRVGRGVPPGPVRPSFEFGAKA